MILKPFPKRRNRASIDSNNPWKNVIIILDFEMDKLFMVQHNFHLKEILP